MAPKKRKVEVVETVPQIEAPVRYFNRTNICDYLICTICQEVFTDPMRVSCGHTFCKVCLDSWLVSRANYGHSCPTCRNVFIVAATHRDFIAVECLQREQVFCKFGGCDWIGPMGSLTNHMSTCEHDPSKLPEWVKTDEPPPSALRLRILGKADAERSARRDASAESIRVDLSDSDVDLR